MKKTIKFLATIITISLLGINASRASESIAIIDVERVAKDAIAVRDIQVKVTKKQEEFQKEIDKKQNSLSADQKKLESRKTILSKEAFEKEQKEFEKKIDSLKELVEKKQEILKKASANAMTKVNDKMKDIVAGIAKEKNLSLILPASQIVFAVDGSDISTEVLEQLNKKVAKVDVKFD